MQTGKSRSHFECAQLMSVWCAMASQCSFQVRWPFHVWMWALLLLILCVRTSHAGGVCVCARFMTYLLLFFFRPLSYFTKVRFPCYFLPSPLTIGGGVSWAEMLHQHVCCSRHSFLLMSVEEKGLSGWGGGEQLRYLSLSLPIRLSPSFDTLHCHPHGSRTSSFPSCLLPHCRCHSSSCPLFIFSFYNSVAAVLLANGPSVHFAPLPLVGFLPSLPSFSCTCGFHLYLSFHPG